MIHSVLLLGAGFVAGLVNVAVGSGSLVTFLALMASGLPPLAANVTNSVAVLPGTVLGAWSYRRDLPVQAGAVPVVVAAVGAVAGAGLLLWLPSDVFVSAVPVLIGVACVLVIVQPLLAKLVRERPSHARPGVAWHAGLGATGVYGAYLGAGQGVILMSLLGLVLPTRLQQANAAKNLLNAVTNGCCAAIFVVLAPVDWRSVPLVALGSACGGQVGARIGRALPDGVLRLLLVAAAMGSLYHVLATQ